jgi:hypothetical protein
VSDLAHQPETGTGALQQDLARRLLAAAADADIRALVVGGEALFAELQPNDATWISPGSQVFPANAAYREKFNTSLTVIRAGLNYKFNGFGP